MRNRFEQQVKIGRLLIEDTEISLKSHYSLLELMAALKEIFVRSEYNERIFRIIEDSILSDKKKTGRKGMDLWQIFVLSQVRLCLNAGYEELHYVANHDNLVRQIMGIASDIGFGRIELEYQNIYDNVTLLDDETILRLNEVILDFGHDVFKKKEGAALRLKTDSFVVETNVHFPTDYNLLWDCARKCLDGTGKFLKKYNSIKGWRKIKEWRYGIKGLMREVGRASVSGGKNKEKRLKSITREYLTKAETLLMKLEKDIPQFPVCDGYDISVYFMIKQYMGLMKKHIDLVERRIINGEQIPHQEKMFSVFETHTEMIKKGKLRPNVELGKMLAITTDQYHLIVDYKLMEEEQDREIICELKKRISSRYTVSSWSFDKGFWSKENKAVLKDVVPDVIMPKLGKRNIAEEEEEGSRKFKKLKNWHSAVESNINELEHRGLDMCPDRGYDHYKRYVGLAVSAYNLKKIGRQLQEEEKKRRQKATAA